MPYWTTMTLAELRAAMVPDIAEDIGQYIAAHFTKRQIIMWLLRDNTEDAGIETEVDQIDCDPASGELLCRVEVYRDLETGAAVGGCVMTWSYYPTGEVDEIIISERNADDVEVARRTIKHYRDGREPEVEVGENV